MSTTIEYNGSIVATVENRNKATIPVKGKQMASDIVVTVPEISAEFNIAYGDTAPTDTSKLWVKTAKPDVVAIANSMFGTIGGVELPEKISGVNAVSVGTKIYLFGGNNTNGDVTTAIHMFDTESNTITTLDATLPFSYTRIRVANVGTKVYLFCAMEGESLSSIYVFDAESNTITFLNIALFFDTDYSFETAVVQTDRGPRVYLFGCGENQDTIRVFDPQTNTISTLSATLPTGLMSTKTAVVGTKVYLLGGDCTDGTSNNITVFDVKRNTATRLDTVLPYEYLYDFGAAVFGKKIYLFGGFADWAINDIWMLDTETNTFSEVDKKLPIEKGYIGVATVGTKAYMFGGGSSTEDSPWWSYLSSISIFTASVPLAPNNLLIDASTPKNSFNLLPNIKSGVNAVYLGNADGVGEKVAAALYKNGEWVEI